MTGTNCDLFTHSQSRSYLNHLVLRKLCSTVSYHPWALLGFQLYANTKMHDNSKSVVLISLMLQGVPFKTDLLA
jgi:hypothetical protein